VAGALVEYRKQFINPGAWPFSPFRSQRKQEVQSYTSPKSHVSLCCYVCLFFFFNKKVCGLISMFYILFISKYIRVGEMDGLQVKSTCCSSTEPEFFPSTHARHFIDTSNSSTRGIRCPPLTSMNTHTHTADTDTNSDLKSSLLEARLCWQAWLLVIC